MFGVVEAIGGLEAEKGLLSIISSDKEEIVRYRAFESVLAAQKAEGIVPALEAFPASASYKKVDVDDLLVKLIEKIGQPARPALVQALGSRAALARMTAVMALVQIGKAPTRRRCRRSRATARRSKVSRRETRSARRPRPPRRS
jgi:HEAT repeat protein